MKEEKIVNYKIDLYRVDTGKKFFYFSTEISHSASTPRHFFNGLEMEEKEKNNNMVEFLPTDVIHRQEKKILSIINEFDASLK